MGFALPAFGQAQSPLAALVRIEAPGREPGSATEHGTGFVVHIGSGGAYVMTANHVVEKAGKILIYFAVAPDAPALPARKVMVDTNLDLAALLVAQVPPQAAALPIQLAKEPGLGEQLHLIGYSLGKRSPAIRQAALAQHQGAEFFLQTEVAEMDSGSPLIYQGGAVGWVKTKDGGYARCSSSSVLATALRGWQIPFTAAPLPAAPKTDSRTGASQPAGSGGTAGSCTGRVFSATGGSKQVFQGASRNSPVAGSLGEGARVLVIGQRFADAKLWYRVSSGDGGVSGYLPQTDLRLDGSCSNP